MSIELIVADSDVRQKIREEFRALWTEFWEDASAWPRRGAV